MNFRLILILVLFILFPLPVNAQMPLSISNISDNRASYIGNTIPKYEKLEISFTINNTVAANLQWPYDLNPPSGVTPSTGISVNAIFTTPSGSTFSQPAFYYQPYDFQRKNGKDWLYPTGQPTWLVRFAPNQEGNWSYRITAQDNSGTTQSPTVNFSVNASSSHGFIRVGKNDSRYFEFDDGTYFPGLGYNMNWNHISWDNPVGDVNTQGSNAYNFKKMGENGIQLVRLWLSEWALYGAKWNPWRCILSRCNPDWPELTNNQSYSDHNISVAMFSSYNPCMSSGHWLSPPIAVKPNTNYRIRVRVRTSGITGPRISGQPYGFVAKITDDGNSWLQGSGNNCQDPGVGKVVTNYLSNSDWTEAVGTYRSGSTTNFLSAFYLTLTNVATGSAYVDQVVIEEDLGSGNYGPNIIIKPGMNHHQYMDQRTSFAFDKVVELAHQNEVYLRPVLLEWQDDAQNMIDSYGFYGNYREITRARWYQQAYWRYMQARYGYSTNIQSWELLNEGDPSSSKLYAMTDEFGKYMHCRAFGVEPGSGDGAKCNLDHPNDHLVSTSLWTQFPKNQFWANSNYPNVDFADVHRYISKSPDSWLDPNFYDTAKSTNDNSMLYGAKQPGGAGKPIVRGETGLIDNTDTNALTSDLLSDTQGVWLHNFIWGGINSGGLIESYWYESYDTRGHIYTSAFDLRPVYKTYYNFIKDIPLTNGHYVDAAASTPTSMRAWGQKDLTNQRAHLWITNSNYRWNNLNPPSVSGSITLNGFQPSTAYRIEWWNTYTGVPLSTQNITTNVSGILTLNVTNLVTDTAVRIGTYDQNPTPTAIPGDANGDGRVDETDYSIWLSHYSPTTTQSGGASIGDLNSDSRVDGLDYVIWLNNYGT